MILVVAVFKTQRLLLRRLTEDDFDFFVTLTQDSLITKYFANFRDLENPQYDFYETIINQQNHGNLFLAICNGDNIPIGILDAFYTANGQWLVEYALLDQYRHNGYLTEILIEICQNDFEFMSIFKTNQSSISSLLFEIQSDNIYSQKVLFKVAKKLGLKLDVDNTCYILTL